MSNGSANEKSRGTLIAGNWKMHKGVDEARDLARAIADGLPATGDHPAVGLFPAAVALAAVAEAIRGHETRILVGAQNMYWEEEGAFTGEISTGMILSAGCRGVLIGHSERRHVFGESDEDVARKVQRALSAGLTPILCLGEKLEEREAGNTERVVERQLSLGLEKVASAEALARVGLADEPVWAIGTGKTATPEQGQAVHRFLRGKLGGIFEGVGGSPGGADASLILYGGSVKPENAAELLAEPDIDGFLVGGASLKAESFLKICAAAGA